jgi:P27 family predicted phage terminase small subunit
MRGRKPKPISQQITEGDRRRHGRLKLATKSNPQPACGLPACPHYLRGHARAAWNVWSAELQAMGLDSAADAQLLEAACVNFQTAVTAHLQIQKQGEVVEELIIARDSGKVIGHRVRKNPWVTVREHAHRLLLSFCSEFGVSPAARTRLNIERPRTDEDEIEKILSGPPVAREPIPEQIEWEAEQKRKRAKEKPQ